MLFKFFFFPTDHLWLAARSDYFLTPFICKDKQTDRRTDGQTDCRKDSRGMPQVTNKLRHP